MNRSVGIGFVAGLLLLCAGMIWTLFYQTKFPSVNRQHLMNGALAGQLEENVEKSLVGKHVLVASWGAISYAGFRTGLKGSVVGQKGWVFTDEEFAVPQDAQVNSEANLAYIKQVKQQLAKDDIALIVALIPAKSDIYSSYLQMRKRPLFWDGYYERLAQKLKQSGVFTLNVKALFARYQGDESLFEPHDTHWSTTGAQLVAQQAALEFETIASDLSRKPFVTSQEGMKPYEPDLLSFVPTGILSDWLFPQQTYPEMKTVAKESAGLFGRSVAEVALVGTSYSAKPEWHFDGFLKQALQADVVNFSSEGEGAFKPMQALLQRLEADEMPIKAVIWEIPERFMPVSYSVTQEAGAR